MPEGMSNIRTRIDLSDWAVRFVHDRNSENDPDQFLE